MKKFTTVLAAICLGGLAAMATNLAGDIVTNAKYTITPEGSAKMKEITQRQQMGIILPGEQTMTRSFQDRNGTTWDLSILLTKEKICDLVEFADEFGNSVKYGFDRLPYYACNMIIAGRKQDASVLDTYIYFMGCWPSYYIYEQVFTYKGELDSQGQIPEALRDYAAVSMTRLANDPNFTQKFKESEYVGEKAIEGTTKFPNWSILQNSMSADGGQCVINGANCITMVNDTYGSSLEFSAFDNETSEITCNITLYYTNIDTGRNQNTRLKYVGTARVEGFEEMNETLPPFGDVHVFNAGIWDSEMFGDENPFTSVWGPYTALYLAAGDEKLKWIIDDTAGPFNTEAISRVVDVESEELDQHANSIEGYLYANKKYGNDTNLNPTGDTYTCIHPIKGEDVDGSELDEIAPSLNTFVPCGYDDITWSNDYGLLLYAHNFPDLLNEGSTISWGTPEGFTATLTNMYMKTFHIQGKGKVIYHYDPMNIAKIREYSSIGDAGVEGVMVSSSVITAANGVISVTPGVATNVAVYNIDGVCVASKAAASGETIEVSAPKGVYLVMVEGKAKKVIL